MNYNTEWAQEKSQEIVDKWAAAASKIGSIGLDFYGWSETDLKDSIAAALAEATAKERQRAEKAEASVAQLRQSRNDQERVLEASNAHFVNAVRKIAHLWDEFNQPPGINMICEKLADATELLKECRDALELARLNMLDAQAHGIGQGGAIERVNAALEKAKEALK